MSKKVADLIIKLGADSYEFQQKVKEVDRNLGKLAKRLDSLGKELSLKLTVPIVALGVLSIKAFDDSAKAVAKVEQAIKSTGGAAKLSSIELGKFASELQGKTLFEDDFILNNSTAQLLTFTNIAGENFKRTQAVALDLATVLDGDLKSASIQLGKALNDPVKNLTALSRAGIQFSKEQIATIKNLAETNRLAQAQGLILSELERQYGGQAEAAAKVGLGALTQLKNKWGDFLEQIGAIMMPLVNKIAGALSVVVSWLQKVNPKVLEMAVVVGGLVAAVGPLIFGLGAMLKSLPLLSAGFVAVISPIKLVITGIKTLSLAIATNPIGLLLTALSAGIGLLIAFRQSTDDVSNANGNLTNKVIDESKQVNTLIARLSSANTSEQQRKVILEELGRIQPDIVKGLSDEKIELEALTRRASEYNQKLVLRIALARKQDQVASALDKQIETGIKHAEKEAALYEKLADIGSRIAEGKFKMGVHSEKKGFFEWYVPSDEQQKAISEQFNSIMASGDKLDEKARKMWLLFKPSTSYSNKIKMDVNPDELTSLSGDLYELNNEIAKTGESVTKAKNDVLNFAKAFSLSLDPPKEDIDEIQKKLAECELDFNGVNTEISRTPGLINNIVSEIEDLETKKLLPKSTIDDIAKANDQITILKEKLSELQNLSLNKFTAKQTTATPEGIESITPIIDVKVPDLSNVMSKVHEQILAIKNAVKDGIFSWADDIDTKLQGSISKVEGIVSNYTSALVDKGWEFNAALSSVTEQIAATMAGLDQALSSFISGTIVSAAETIGGIIAGDLGFGDLLNSIVGQMAQFIKQIGVQLIEFGVQMLALKLALDSVLENPFAAIAIGAAMVVASAIMTSSIKKNAAKNVPKLANGGLAYGATYAMVGDNPNASVDPEVIAPLSKLKGIMAQGGNQNISIHLTGELKAKGRDLVYVIGKENFKLGLLGG